jgi:hypothetical protein
VDEIPLRQEVLPHEVIKLLLVMQLAVAVDKHLLVLGYLKLPADLVLELLDSEVLLGDEFENLLGFIEANFELDIKFVLYVHMIIGGQDVTGVNNCDAGVVLCLLRVSNLTLFCSIDH